MVPLADLNSYSASRVVKGLIQFCSVSRSFSLSAHFIEEDKTVISLGKGLTRFHVFQGEYLLFLLSYEDDSGSVQLTMEVEQAALLLAITCSSHFSFYLLSVYTSQSKQSTLQTHTKHMIGLWVIPIYSFISVYVGHIQWVSATHMNYLSIVTYIFFPAGFFCVFLVPETFVSCLKVFSE